MNDVVVNKAQSIQRCVKRAREELQGAGDSFDTDYTRQDAAMLNVTRACEQAIDLANHLVKTRKLGVPADSRESFQLLAEAHVLSRDLADRLKRMIGFRNIAVHEYEDLDLEIARSVIATKSEDLVAFSRIALMSEADVPAVNEEE